MKLNEIRSLAQIMQDAGLTGLEVNEGDVKIRLEKRPPAMSAAPVVMPSTPPAAAPADASAQKAGNDESFREVKSPMVGVFYVSPSPESEPYVKVGSTVKKGDVICIIEAMKLLNEINSDQDGEVAEICVENGQVVEYGQTLFRLR